MGFQKTSECAIRIFIYLGINKNEYVLVNQLHKTLELPYKYIGRLMSRLAKAY